MEKGIWRKLSSDIRAVADDIDALLGVDKPAEPEKPKEPEKHKISRGELIFVFAEKSKAGFREQLKDIISSYGAERVSEIPPEYWDEAMAKVEALQ
jgi:hypothetical protein